MVLFWAILSLCILNMFLLIIDIADDHKESKYDGGNWILKGFLLLPIAGLKLLIEHWLVRLVYLIHTCIFKKQICEHIIFNLIAIIWIPWIFICNEFWEPCRITKSFWQQTKQIYYSIIPYIFEKNLTHILWFHVF